MIHADKAVGLNFRMSVWCPQRGQGPADTSAATPGAPADSCRGGAAALFRAGHALSADSRQQDHCGQTAEIASGKRRKRQLGNFAPLRGMSGHVRPRHCDSFKASVSWCLKYVPRSRLAQDAPSSSHLLRVQSDTRVCEGGFQRLSGNVICGWWSWNYEGRSWSYFQ